MGLTASIQAGTTMSALIIHIVNTYRDNSAFSVIGRNNYIHC